jgi:hypothetical protein
LSHGYPEPRAPWGEKARGEPAVGAEARAPRLAPCAPHFPPLRERAAGPPPAAALKYERIDGPAAPVTLTAADTLVFRFSGRPDSIFLSARVAPALVTLTDRLGRESSTIMVPVDTTVETFVARDTVLARDGLGGATSVLSVVGKWAALDEPSSAY